MRYASLLARSASLAVLLAVACGEPKPAATTTPAPAGTKAAAAKPAEADKGPVAVEGGDKVKVVEGKAPGGDDRYALVIEPPADAATGKESEVMVRVVPKAPWHMNLDFPTSLKLTPPEGLVLASDNLQKGDASKLDAEHCDFAVKVTPSAAGEHAVSGQFKFAVCQDEACSPVTETVEFKVAVK